MKPFPVAPADVPMDAVNFVMRTLLRNTSPAPFDEELARVIVAGVIAVLAQEDPMRAPERGRIDAPAARRRRPAATVVEGM